MDGGANAHIFTDKNHFKKYKSLKGGVQQVSGTTEPTIGIGLVMVQIPNSSIIITLWPFYHMPNNPQITISQNAIKKYNKFRSVIT